MLQRLSQEFVLGRTSEARRPKLEAESQERREVLGEEGTS